MTKTEQYNPFAGIAELEGIRPIRLMDGTCYARAVFEFKSEADKVGAVVRGRGDTANGGFMHGMLLGNVTRTHDGFWEVDYA